MKLRYLCRLSGLECDNFGHKSKNRHLPAMLKHHPQHIIYNNEIVRLVYFKPSYDPLYVDLSGEEIRSLNYWETVEKVRIFIYNYFIKKYSIVQIPFLMKAFTRCKKSGKNYAFDNTMFEWHNIFEPIKLEEIK